MEILISGKNKKSIVYLSSAELAQKKKNINNLVEMAINTICTIHFVYKSVNKYI